MSQKSLMGPLPNRRLQPPTRTLDHRRFSRLSCKDDRYETYRGRKKVGFYASTPIGNEWPVRALSYPINVRTLKDTTSPHQQDARQRSRSASNHSSRTGHSRNVTFEEFLAATLGQSTSDPTHDADAASITQQSEPASLRQDMVQFLKSKGCTEDHARYLCDEWRLG